MYIVDFACKLPMLKNFFEMISMKDILQALFIGIKCCLKKPVTQNLPEIKRSPKFRNGFKVDITKCVKCGTCERICPNKSVKLLNNDFPIFDLNRCCYCRLCQKSCPKSAIQVSPIQPSSPEISAKQQKNS